MLTICSTPKKWQGEQQIIQTNAVKSWLSLGCDVLLIGDEEGTPEACDEFGCMWAAEIRRNAQGTPLMSSIFENVRDRIHTQYAIYVNADIMLCGKILEAFEACLPLKNFLMVGERHNAEIGELVDFNSNWEARIKLNTYHPGRRARDYFIYNKDMFANMPPFAVGRGKWDSWIVGESLLNNWPVIDSTKAITCIHQNHEFDHIPGTKIKRGLWGKKGNEYDYNMALIPQGHPCLSTLKTTAFLTADLRLVYKDIWDTNKR